MGGLVLDNKGDAIIQAKVFKKCLLDKELNYRKLAEKTNLSEAVLLSAVEKGIPVSYDIVTKIAKFLEEDIQILSKPQLKSKLAQNYFPKIEQQKKDTPPSKDVVAVIFTHFHGLTFKKYQNDDQGLIHQYRSVISSYLSCNRDKIRIGLVYCYIDDIVKEFLSEFKVTMRDGKVDFNVPDNLREKERRLTFVVKSAEEQARAELGLNGDAKPIFEYITIEQLSGVIKKLIEADPRMPNLLSGKGSKFTYDSPKFVEAVIRLARGDIPELSRHPIIRIDDDAIVVPQSIDNLLNAVADIISRRPIYFLSGTYGRSDKQPDPVNDHAVRTAWFFPNDIMAGDSRFGDPPDDVFKNAMRQCDRFLADFSLLGAPQFSIDKEHIHTKSAVELQKTNVISRDPYQKSGQVISGAGLVMSRRAIAFLPPFMNIIELTTWVDDYLKRCLHEVIEDITHNDPSRIINATFEQSRHPAGIQEDDKKWSKHTYFDRVLRGCIMHALIVSNEGKATNYSLQIRDAARLVKKEKIKKKELESLRKNMYNLAEQRCNIVQKCWMSSEYEHTILYEYAISMKKEDISKQCNRVVDDALRYLDLVVDWPIFERAISRLSFAGNDWLYRKPF